MIIDGGHHGIRLYEREVQPHENFVGIDIAKFNRFATIASPHLLFLTLLNNFISFSLNIIIIINTTVIIEYLIIG